MIFDEAPAAGFHSTPGERRDEPTFRVYRAVALTC